MANTEAEALVRTTIAGMLSKAELIAGDGESIFATTARQLKV